MQKLIPLSRLIPGEAAVVRRLDSKGALRRRLQTAGFLENTEVRCAFRSPLGDPSAYLVRGTVLALRRKDADSVRVEKKEEPRQTAGERDPLLVLAGNPNVGKSTVFNALTGMKQHTGNWAGKTVECAVGGCRIGDRRCQLVDLPGCYSLLSGSAEENAARDFLLSHTPDAVISICDASRLESTLPLTLQLLEMGLPVLLCVNLMDEARKRGNPPRLSLLEKRLSIPTAGTSANRRGGLDELLEKAASLPLSGPVSGASSFSIPYPSWLETALSLLAPAVQKARREEDRTSFPGDRWVCLRLLEQALGRGSVQSETSYANACITDSEDRLDDGNGILDGDRLDDGDRAGDGDSGVKQALASCLAYLSSQGIDQDKLLEARDAACRRMAEKLCRGICPQPCAISEKDHRLEKLFTGKRTAFPVMLLLLFFLFWLTIRGANYPSALLSAAFLRLEELLAQALLSAGLPGVLVDLTIGGIFGTTARVISVMLPPMAIFFPPFTLLEDAGVLPRIAFNLDRGFQRCGACGKQAITIAMGLGCNAVGVTGSRIMEEKRERLLAVLTNSFVPCNGRLPALLTLSALLFSRKAARSGSPVLGAAFLLGLLLLGVFMTFLTCRLLSATLLKGEQSPFLLELPAFRRPRLLQVLLRSVWDRTLCVLGRAVCTAAPAGLILWLLSHLRLSDGSILLARLTAALDPTGRSFGMDGTILTGFLLGFPANEIVLPITAMAYSAQNGISAAGGLSGATSLFSEASLLENGWSRTTVVCTALFFLMHWPCATTLLTIRKETGSLRWTLAAFLLPTLCGLGACFLANLLLSAF